MSVSVVEHLAGSVLLLGVWKCLQSAKPLWFTEHQTWSDLYWKHTVHIYSNASAGVMTLDEYLPEIVTINIQGNMIRMFSCPPDSCVLTGAVFTVMTKDKLLPSQPSCSSVSVCLIDRGSNTDVPQTRFLFLFFFV